MKLPFLIIFSFLLVFDGSSKSCQSKKPSLKDVIIVEATVLKMAPPVAPSGLTANFRLVKYKVVNVCRGKYEGENIVVDHYIIKGDELQNIEVGSRVYLPIMISDKIDNRYNAEEIRTPSEIVNKYYIGFKSFIADKSNCSYQESDLLYIKK